MAATVGKKQGPIVRKVLEEELSELVAMDKRCFKYNNVTMLDMWEYRDKTFVLSKGKKLLGFYFYMEKGDYLYLASIDIDKPWRGKGYSKLLMNHFLKHKAKYFALHVKKSNKIAINLYKSYGFDIRYIEEGFYEDESDAYFMIKKI